MLEIFLYILSLLPSSVIAFIAGYIATKITSKVKIILLGIITAIIVFCYNGTVLYN